MAVRLLPISNDVGIELGKHQSNIRMMSGYTIFKGVRVQSGRQRFNIIMTTAMLKLSGYIIFNNVSVRLGRLPSNIGMMRAMLRLSGYTIFNDVCVGLGGQPCWKIKTIA